jgi:hypothetical protein
VIDCGKVLPKLHEKRADGDFAGLADDALDDIRMFAMDIEGVARIIESESAYVRNFTLTDMLGDYDKAGNPSALSVFELLPHGVSWSYGGRRHEISHEKKVVAVLVDGKAIAIIQAPSQDIPGNKAYIVDGNARTIWDVSAMAAEKFRQGKVFRGSSPLFWDVRYQQNGPLWFFLHIGGTDFRFSFDPLSGSMGELAESC